MGTHCASHNHYFNIILSPTAQGPSICKSFILPQRPKMSSFFARRALRTAAPLSRTFSSSALRSSFAKMTIVGRLADTPELLPTSTGKEILRYSVGTNSGRGDNQKTNWFRVTAFLPEGPQRDFIAGLDKGYVNSKLRSRLLEPLSTSKERPR